MPEFNRQWTIVRHSGYGYGHDPTFSHAVETRTVTSIGQARLVERAGGVLFGSYRAAEDFAEKANHPPGAGGIIPRCKGTFGRCVPNCRWEQGQGHAASCRVIDGLSIYIPVREATG